MESFIGILYTAIGIQVFENHKQLRITFVEIFRKFQGGLSLHKKKV